MHKQQFDDVIDILTTEDEGRIWKTRYSSPGCSFVWTLRVVYGLVTPEREVAGSILGARPILRVLNKLQAVRSSRGSDDHVKWRRRKNSVPNYYFHAKYIDTQIKCVFSRQSRILPVDTNLKQFVSSQEIFCPSCEMFSFQEVEGSRLNQTAKIKKQPGN